MSEDADESRPTDPVDVSTAEAGDIADEPGDGDLLGLELSDEDDDTYGFLIKWGDGEWIFAKKPDYEGLNGRT